MRESSSRILVAAGLVSAVALGAGAALAAEPEPQAIPQFVAGPCPDKPEPIPALANARCGALVVPENRAAANDRKIRLPVAILPAIAADPLPDPVVYMEGGPGGAALPTAQLLLDMGLNRRRDFIVMGQRGTLYAEPALTCPEIDDFNTGPRVGMGYDDPRTGEAFAEAAGRCHRRLAGQGIDLAGFNTTENAADFADLRRALGIERWNVYGVSYGTDLALTYMRDHPEGIRSVTIDSVVPPHLASLGVNWTNSADGLHNIFRACAADIRCKARYPDPVQQFTNLVWQLNEEPIVVETAPVLMPGDAPPPDAAKLRTVLDGGALANWMTGMNEVVGRRLPELLDRMTKGDTTPVVASVAAANMLHAGDLSWGLHNGVVCSEWVPYETPADVLSQGKAAYPDFPERVLAHPPQFAFMAELCGQWPVPKAPAAQREPTRSDIPTLVAAGSYDAITAPGAAKSAAAGLTHATFLLIPGVGHFAIPKSDCAKHVMLSFLDDPGRPEMDCVSIMKPPAFVIGKE